MNKKYIAGGMKFPGGLKFPDFKTYCKLQKSEYDTGISVDINILGTELRVQK
jgi:hypothetical protein